jgi:hypothetical protein
MAEETFESREINYRQWLPWTQLFRGFWLALDHKKLLLAAAGILLMAFGWWILALAFSRVPKTKPAWPTDFPVSSYRVEGDSDRVAEMRAWKDFKEHRNSWNLLYEASFAGPDPSRGEDGFLDEFDLADSLDDVPRIKEVSRSSQGRVFEKNGEPITTFPKPHGRLRTWPWFEDRGPNPALLLTGRAGTLDAEGVAHRVPWQQGRFFDWLFRDQIPVLIEPLVKFFRPVGYLLSPHGTFLVRLYFLLVIVWTLATWAVFGGAITRIAAIQIARNDRIGLAEALRFTLARWRSYFFASFAPLLGIAFIALGLVLFGIGNLIPGFAEVWDGVLWFVPLGLGLLMAFVLVGLIGWPMIHATLSTEGSDSFDALSRSYSYVYQKPWNYLWYALVALAYGAVVVFFVGLMGSLMVYLSKWGVNQTPLSRTFNRDPSYLFVYAPTSFGWRELLLQGSPVVGNSSAVTQTAIDNYINTDFRWWNFLGAGLVAFWLGLAFLMVIGFSYSYFWSASTIIYLLMRRKVDDTEIDEVYLEEEDTEEPYGAPTAPPSGTSQPITTAGAPQMVEAPTLRPSAPVGSPPPATTPAGEGPAPVSGELAGGQS